MNYMQMVKFNSVSSTEVVAEAYYSKREEFFRDHFKFKKVVPTYVILESIFQTSGRLIRENTSNKSAGIIASFSKFNFSRPILPHEMIEIHTHLKSINDKSALVEINIYSDEHIMKSGRLILILNDEIVQNSLNNSDNAELKTNRSYFKRYQ